MLELKAKSYDIIVEIEQAQAFIGEKQKQLAELSKQLQQLIDEEAKKAEAKKK